MLHHPAFAPLPHLAQFAKNGRWEAAWSFPRTSPASRADIRDYLAGATEVAFEVFFGDAFFGARFSGEACEVEALASVCTQAFQQACDGADFFSRLSDDAAFDGLGRSIAFAEIGAVNAWQSVGAFRTPPPHEALRDFDALWSSLVASPLVSHRSHRKAVEFACPLPLPHWFALPVSSPRPPFALDRDRLRQAYEFAARGD
jgi:hypothetical protein